MQKLPLVSRALLLLLTIGAVFVMAVPAGATLAGRNGKIVFVSERDLGLGEIYTMNPDGSAPTRLTTNFVADELPRWSPDGQRIAFVRQRADGSATSDLFVMSSDGTGEILVSPVRGDTPNVFDWSPDGDLLVAVQPGPKLVTVRPDGTGSIQIAEGSAPAWSPGGSLVAFRSADDPTRVDLVRPDGADRHTIFTGDAGTLDAYPVAWSPDSRFLLVGSTANASNSPTSLYRVDLGVPGPPTLIFSPSPSADWSPDGSRLAVMRLFCTLIDCTGDILTMDPDGSNRVQITASGFSERVGRPRWAPDGTRIVFESATSEIQSAAPDGSSIVNLTNNSARDRAPDWQRLGPAPATLDLAPASATNTINSQHCVTATVRDAAGEPTPNEVVRFTVSGSVDTTGSTTTDASGEGTFCYDGPTLSGEDQIIAFADTNADGDQDLGEPVNVAQKTWVPPASTPGCETSHRGQIIAENGDGATFTGNAGASLAGEPSGSETYTDLGLADRVVMRSTSIDAVVCSSGDASVFGRADVNGDSRSFRIDLHDGGGRKKDAYRIRLGNGYDSGTKIPRRGHVSVR